MWKQAENSNSVRPDEIVLEGGHVIVRKNFRLIQDTEERPEHWEYMEAQMTEEQYQIYSQFEEQLKEQEDALVELAGIIAEV